MKKLLVMLLLVALALLILHFVEWILGEHTAVFGALAYLMADRVLKETE